MLTSIWRLRTLASSSHGAFSFARQTHTTSAFLALNARGQHSANTKGSATPVVSNTIVSMGVFFLMAAAINSLVRLSTSPFGEQHTHPPPKSKTFAVASGKASSLGGWRACWPNSDEKRCSNRATFLFCLWSAGSKCRRMKRDLPYPMGPVTTITQRSSGRQFSTLTGAALLGGWRDAACAFQRAAACSSISLRMWASGLTTAIVAAVLVAALWHAARRRARVVRDLRRVTRPVISQTAYARVKS